MLRYVNCETELIKEQLKLIVEEKKNVFSNPNRNLCNLVDGNIECCIIRIHGMVCVLSLFSV